MTRARKLTLAAAVLVAAAAAGFLLAYSLRQPPAPTEAAMPGLDGRSYRVDSWRGQVVVLNFWATWCDPCRDEMPSFNRLKARMRDAPFVILAVNMAEGEARIGEFLKRVPVEFPVLLDRDSAVSKSWRARLLPYTVVLDPAQRIRYTALGELDWGAPAVEATLRKLLPAR
jgi:thiol-disulfide isomerase/thioredoxin